MDHCWVPTELTCVDPDLFVDSTDVWRDLKSHRLLSRVIVHPCLLLTLCESNMAIEHGLVEMTWVFPVQKWWMFDFSIIFLNVYQTVNLHFFLWFPYDFPNFPWVYGFSTFTRGYRGPLEPGPVVPVAPVTVKKAATPSEQVCGRHSLHGIPKIGGSQKSPGFFMV